jgi:5'(3')-deoxyribonucleotidase
MKISHLDEGVGRIVQGVNTTADVGVNQTSKEAAKFGFKVDKDGKPPTHPKKIKGSPTNVLTNLGITGKSVYEAKITDYELALMEGGHTIEQKPYRPLSGIMLELAAHDFKEALGELNPATEFYIDMDGVLADFFGEWAKLMNVKHFTHIGKEHNIDDALQKIRDTDQFWLELPLLPQARELLELVKKVKGSYNICSSPLADDPKSEPHKREWIKKNLAFFPPKNVYITHNKPQYATQKDGTPNILIDDYGVNINAWEAAGGIGYKYKDHKFERTANLLKKHLSTEADVAYNESLTNVTNWLKTTFNPDPQFKAWLKMYKQDPQKAARTFRTKHKEFLSQITEDVDIDNKDGWGAVPYNQEVDYRGLRVKMKPSVFINLAASRNGEPPVPKVVDHVKNGGSIGAPFLSISVDEDESQIPEVVGHEGRSRMAAILEVHGDVPVETHLFFQGKVSRARHITPEFVEKINRYLISENDKMVRGPLFEI